MTVFSSLSPKDTAEARLEFAFFAFLILDVASCFVCLFGGTVSLPSISPITARKRKKKKENRNGESSKARTWTI
jgi:hypothetical protein